MTLISMLDYKKHFPVPIRPDTQVVFFESRPAHSYLFDLYGNRPRTQLVSKPGFLWGSPQTSLPSFLHFNEQHLKSQVKSVFFLTIDYFTFPHTLPILFEWLEGKHQKMFGILHELPSELRNVEIIRRLSQRVHLLVFTEDMKSMLDSEKIGNVSVLPHHAIHFLYKKKSSNELRTQLKIPEDSFVATFLGELREGKGIETILESLRHLDSDFKNKIFFNFAGKSRDYNPKTLLKAFQKQGVQVRLNIGKNSDPAEYRILSDQQYIQEIFFSDVLLLPYEGRQSRVMSGVLPDAIHFDVPVICAKESQLGKLTERYSLGKTFKEKNSQEFAQCLQSVLRNPIQLEGQADDYKNLISPKNILNTLAKLLEIS